MRKNSMVERHSAVNKTITNGHDRMQEVSVRIAQNKLSNEIQEMLKQHYSSQRTVETFIVIWLDSDIKNSAKDFDDWISQLRTIVKTIITFDDLDQTINYINQPRSEKVFVIVSNNFGPSLLPHIHTNKQLASIYVFNRNKSSNDIWIRQWTKVKGIFTRIDLLCQSLKQDTQQWENDLNSFSIVSSINITDIGSNELDQSFMYSQILKEILLDIEYNDKAKKEFVKFCREQYHDNERALAVIDEFEQYYPFLPKVNDNEQEPSPIWWYTRESFIYSMLNKALRTQDIEIIIKMGFFMQDIHRHIEQLHLLSSMKRASFTVYRGQNMSNVEFDQIKNNPSGLLFFNSFLSTSQHRNVALRFAKNKPDMITILFQMAIDPSSLFAQLDDDISFFKEREKEVLFSMHTVFRIGGMRQIDDGKLWEVDLKLTKNDDEELKILSNQIRKEIGVGIGWDRMGTLLVKMGELDKAEDIYTTLLRLTRDDDWKMLAHLYNQLGYIVKQKGDLSKALKFYEQALSIQDEFLSSTHIDLATTYSNIGSVHDSLGDHSIALSFYQKALVIKQKSLSPNDPSIATIYNNIALVHDAMENQWEALSFYRKALTIQQRTLAANHPSIGTTYNNMGKVYRSMQDYPTALSFYEKACDIFQKSLPPNHPSLAPIYNNIGLVHDLMEDYSTALEFYQKTLDIKQKSLPSNHPSFSTTYNNIAFVYKSMKNYATAFEFYQKALDIAQKSLPSSHQDIQDLKEQIVFVRKRL